jgi:hypothetical protein
MEKQRKERKRGSYQFGHEQRVNIFSRSVGHHGMTQAQCPHSRILVPPAHRSPIQNKKYREFQ